MKHDEAIERTKAIIAKYRCKPQRTGAGFRADLADAEALKTLLANCKTYADALVRLVQWTKGMSANPEVCYVCGSSLRLDLRHDSSCPAGIGLAIIKEREEHGPRQGG